MTAQVVLIIIGALLFVVSIAGSGDYVQFKVPALPAWARITLGIAGCTIFALAFTPFINEGNRPEAVSPAPSPKTASPVMTASPVESSASSQSSVNAPYATLQSPKDGAIVSKSQGFTVSGRAKSFGQYTIWILDFDGGYTVDQEASVTSGLWTATDQPLGDSSDHLPFNLTMKAVLANPHCAGILSEVNSTNDDYIQKLPADCKIIGQVTVRVSRP